MKNFIWIIVGVILLVGFGFLVKNQQIEQKNNENVPKIIKIGEITLNIGIANTNEEREQGLSEKSGLKEDEGMLFIFENEGYYGFWMKDMNFPIDIAWLDKDKKIIHIENNISPETYPKIFTPISPNLYVLETSANFFENHKIKIGDIAEF